MRNTYRTALVAVLRNLYNQGIPIPLTSLQLDLTNSELIALVSEVYKHDPQQAYLYGVERAEDIERAGRSAPAHKSETHGSGHQEGS